MKLPVNLSHLDIEIVRGCFLRCRWCPLDKSRPYEFMEIDLFEEIVNKLETAGGEHLKIDLFRWGEPFLYPDIKALLSILERRPWSRSAQIEFYTNGMIISHEQAAAIADSSLEIETIFSVDGTGDRESYEYMRQGARWDVLKRNISMLSSFRERSHFEVLKKVSLAVIIPHQVAVPFTVPEKARICSNFEKEFMPLGVDHFYYRGIHRYNGDIILDGMPDKEMRNGPCCFVKRGGISILIDGRVSACCADMAGNLIVGDLRSDSLEEIYYGQKLASVREAMIQGERYRLDVCRSCDLR